GRCTQRLQALLQDAQQGRLVEPLWPEQLRVGAGANFIQQRAQLLGDEAAAVALDLVRGCGQQLVDRWDCPNGRFASVHCGWDRQTAGEAAASLAPSSAQTADAAPSG